MKFLFKHSNKIIGITFVFIYKTLTNKNIAIKINNNSKTILIILKKGKVNGILSKY